VIEVALNALESPHGKGGAQAAIDGLGQQVKA
jgi:alanine-glyoxylate transaminase/serine-glyoxylate transaminase/serine-pyruvate transaminase